MSADSTLPGSAERTDTRRARTAPTGRPVVAFVPRPAPADLLRPPARVPLRERGVRTGLALVDGTAALLSAALLPGALLSAAVPAGLLVAVPLVPHLRRGRRGLSVPGALETLPVLLLTAVAGWCTAAAVLAGLHPWKALGVGTLAAGCALQSVLAFAGRALLGRASRRAAAARPVAALVLGEKEQAQQIAAAVLRCPKEGLRPVGVVPTAALELPAGRSGSGAGTADLPVGSAGPAAGTAGPASPADPAEGARLPVLSSPEEVRRAVVQNAVGTVLVVGASASAERRELLGSLAELGLRLWLVDARTGFVTDGRRRLAGYACEPLVPLRLSTGGAAKRLLDVTASALALLALSPLLGLCALTLRLTEGPGVIFRQERVGLGGVPFTLLKFRTYRPADARESATRWSVAGEERISPFCRFLRSTSLDELPQLWNVLRGDMSLVGPRPERPYFVAEFARSHPGYADRHRMPVGITGLAQVGGLRGNTSIEDRVRHDNAYIDGWSLWGDVCLLLRTASSLVRRQGS